MTNFILTIAFLFATLGTTLNTQNLNQDLINQLKPEEIILYKNITIMRRNIYFTGLIIGVIMSLIFLLYTSSYDYYYRLFGAISITFCVNYFYYILYPKPIYMLNVLDTSSENKAWLKIYRTMQLRYHLSFLFGLCFAFFLYKIFINYK